MISIMELTKSKIKIWTILFWLLVWQAISMILNQEILLVSPFTVILRLTELLKTVNFYQSIVRSLVNISLGFIVAMIVGILMAIFAAKYNWFKHLLAPLIFTVKSIPVASFIILVLIWVRSAQLSIVISFLMVFPIFYENVRKGIEMCDHQLLEMADVFELSNFTRIRYIYTSSILPYFQSACSLALGLAWKSGIAAEVIGLPKFSIGEHLQQAKVYFDTADLFAWTLVIIILSTVLEKLVMTFIRLLIKYIETECL